MNLSQNSIFLENKPLPKTPVLIKLNYQHIFLCKYDDRFWIGIVSEIYEVVCDVKVKFMHPYYPAVSFFGHTEMMFGGQNLHT